MQQLSLRIQSIDKIIRDDILCIVKLDNAQISRKLRNVNNYAMNKTIRSVNN